MKLNEVFGISTKVLQSSYVDRAQLDTIVQADLEKAKHLALRGESKCGKSWLRQKLLPDAIVVQCRLNKTVDDIYRDVFSQLGLAVIVEKTATVGVKTAFTAETELGLTLIGKLKAKLGFEAIQRDDEKSLVIGGDIEDLRFISEALKESGRRLVIEDFHYLTPSARAAFAHDLKTLWDLEAYIVIIGIWTDNNMLVHLCPDLANRIVERSIFWGNDDLRKVISSGASALNLEIDSSVQGRILDDAFGTVGLLQTLIYDWLSSIGVYEKHQTLKVIASDAGYEEIALDTADQLNAVYQTFAHRVVSGIRIRKNSTGIYAHALKSIMESSDEELQKGIPTDEIFRRCHDREKRIQKPNLRQILGKLEELQVDQEGRGLIISYVSSREEVTVVDKQLFFYRRYATVAWPWDRVIDELKLIDESFETDETC